MGLIQQFNSFIREHRLFTADAKLLLAVSGGVDSVVLCELCKQSGFDFIIAHCNFQLRGEESERDERFVKELGKKYGVEVLVSRFDTNAYAAQKKISVQEAARELRYGWFDELVGKSGNRKSEIESDDSRLPTILLTAHHADDNAETVLMNFCRGTGLHGLTGIPVAISNTRRPLLGFSKQALLQYAQENNLAYVEDSSNQSSKYTRNLFRNEIIPLIAKAYPQVKDNLQDNINRFKEIENLYRFSVGEIKKKLCRKKGKEIHIPVKQLLSLNNRALVYDIISEYGFNEKQVDEVFKLAESESGRYIQSPDHAFRIIRHRHWFIISPALSKEAENLIIEKGIGNLEFGSGQLIIMELPNSKLPIPNSQLTACLDLKQIEFPLLLRKWKTGDYFYPLGMKKKKKLSRFFIDQKLSKTTKENVWVIESNKRIVWVVGHRIDERFKITDKTKQLLQLSVTA